VATESRVSGGTFLQGLGNNNGNLTHNIVGTATDAQANYATDAMTDTGHATYTWLDSDSYSGDSYALSSVHGTISLGTVGYGVAATDSCNAQDRTTASWSGGYSGLDTAVNQSSGSTSLALSAAGSYTSGSFSLSSYLLQGSSAGTYSSNDSSQQSQGGATSSYVLNQSGQASDTVYQAGTQNTAGYSNGSYNLQQSSLATVAAAWSGPTYASSDTWHQNGVGASTLSNGTSLPEEKAVTLERLSAPSQTSTALAHRSRLRRALAWCGLVGGLLLAACLVWGPAPPKAPPAGERGAATAGMPQGPDGARTADGRPARLRRIETIRLGERVLGRNPQGAAAEAEPDSATWRQVELELHKPSGRLLYAGLLRGPAWLAAHKPEVGGTVWLDMPEMGAVGWAKVTAVKPCPQIEGGPGQVVTGTFKHEPDDSILDLRVEGLAEPIGVTDTHPFWSEDRQAFVAVRNLSDGERIRTEALGVVAVTSISHRPREAWVYNLEVNGQHVYEVSLVGVLVHNANSMRRDGLANLQEMGLGDVNLVGKSYNAGRKSLEAAGFVLDRTTSSGRKVFRNPKTGAEVYYDSGGALGPRQKPHWHIKDKGGQMYDRSGRPVGPDDIAGHIPAG
jgi:hypothetical protein